MKLASMILGITALVGMLVGFIPCLGWLNWFNIPVALIGLILGLVDYTNTNNEIPVEPYDPLVRRPKPLPIGAILCGVALFLCSIRLVLGGGII